MNLATRAFLGAVALPMMVGCSNMAGTRSNLPPAEQVQARATERWEKVIAGDWASAYEIMTPGYREIHPFEDYEKSMVNRQVNWTKFEVLPASCETEESCTVPVRITYELIGGLRGAPNVGSTRLSKETWLRSDGRWYYLPARSR